MQSFLVDKLYIHFPDNVNILKEFFGSGMLFPLFAVDIVNVNYLDLLA